MVVGGEYESCSFGAEQRGKGDRGSEWGEWNGSERILTMKSFELGLSLVREE